MKRILCLFFGILIFSMTASHAQHDSETLDLEIKQLLAQAQLLIQRGASQEEVLRVIKENFAQERISAARPHQNNKLLYCCLASGCIMGGLVYLWMRREINKQTQQAQILNDSIRDKDLTIAGLQGQLSMPQMPNISQLGNVFQLLMQANGEGQNLNLGQLVDFFEKIKTDATNFDVNNILKQAQESFGVNLDPTVIATTLGDYLGTLV